MARKKHQNSVIRTTIRSSKKKQHSLNRSTATVSSHHQSVKKRNKVNSETVSTDKFLSPSDHKKKKRKYNRLFYGTHSQCYALLSLLLCFLFLSAIIAIIVIFVNKPTKVNSSKTIVSTVCSCLCPGEQWTFTSNLLARWSFDGNLNDTMKMYDATANQSPIFVDGYVNQAVSLNATTMQSFSTSYIPLSSTSFTIEAWLRPTSFPNSLDHGILGLCPTIATNLCLHLTIRKITSNNYLYISFYNNNCQGNTPLTADQWIHVAFVFDLSSLTLSIYLDGLLDAQCIVSGPLLASMGTVTIGAVPALISMNNLNFFQGYIDHLSITNRAKSSCEIREDATLVSCFPFDTTNTDAYSDYGPNSLLKSYMSTTIISSHHSSDAISFNGTATSYFQALSFTGLGMSTQPFSILLWIRPRSLLTSTVVHVSKTISGTGWCYPFIGFALNGSVIVQVYHVPQTTLYGPLLPMSPTWTHLVETWSPINGLRLYINGTLVASNSLYTSYVASAASNVVTLGNSLSGYNACVGMNSIGKASGPFDGDIGDFRVYTRQLTAFEITTIYNM